MFKRMLVPLDGSTRAERALPVAARIARATGGSLVLLQATSFPVDYGLDFASNPSYAQTMLDDALATAKNTSRPSPIQRVSQGSRPKRRQSLERQQRQSSRMHRRATLT